MTLPGARWFLSLIPFAWGLYSSHAAEQLPHTAEESLKEIVLPPGYRAELVAGEPQIEEPVWLAWDGNGRMYVAEMRSYMQDVQGTGTKARNGRIKRLKDSDGDGRMDKVTVFADGLLLPRMILPLDERVLVQETDDSSLWSLRDTDGDGAADERVLMWKGAPSKSSVEHQDSALTWALDNWLYSAQGRQRHRFTSGQWTSERCLGEFNQWALGMDDAGTLFFSENAHPGRSFQQPWYAWSLIGEKTKWNFARPTLGADTDEAFQLVHPTNKLGDRSDEPQGSFTAACGLSIYRGDALPELAGDLFICEPTGHLVRRAKVERADGKITLRNAHPGAEFFASRDPFCRPVSTHTGPDGCLYIVDMYRGIIQDAPWVGAEFAARLKRLGMDRVKMRGRIWRIVPSDSPSGGRQKPPQMLEEKPAELVRHLAHPNGWRRDTAQKLIILRGDRSVIPALLDMARTHASARARLHALWTLEGMDAATKPVLFEKLRDADPLVRAAATRLCEALLRAGDEEAVQRLAALASDPDITVKRQLVLSLGFSQSAEAASVIDRIAEAHIGNEIIFLAAVTALWQRETPFIQRVRDGSVFRAMPDAAARTAAQARWKAGLQAWTGQIRAPRPLDAEAVELVEKGSEIYRQLCIACHGEDGQGVQPPGQRRLAPRLAGSPRVVGPKELLARILLHGLAGPIDGQTFEAGVMAPMGMNDDAWVAGVLSYIRQEWSNAASVIRPDEVARIRARTQTRATPWTLDELHAFALPQLTDRAAWRAAASHYDKPGNAIDGERDGGHRSSWHGVNEPGCWYAVDLGAPHVLTGLALDSFHDAHYPRAWQLEVSDNGHDWSGPIATGNGEGMLTTITFEPVQARHFRITQTGHAVDRWQITEVNVFGAPATGR